MMRQPLTLPRGLRCLCCPNGDAGMMVTLGTSCLPDDVLPAIRSAKRVGEAKGIPQLLRSSVCAERSR
ncbi:hypothetical protein NDU88_007828 [Pleurodeles waltl]|uniref:Uncharacterized protein n=1 Tax=Pleurodeles waltl TaxID=8319 RepID=A0AAV7NZ26_PLEWA|nr:hypothetical protein NDU88_007828 [Pleurodeles waltl]